MNPVSFAKWATDPVRTVEEKYGALLLIEATAHQVYWKRYQIVLEVEFYRGPIPRKQRSGDPGYIPHIEYEYAQWTEDYLPELTVLFLGRYDDRPLRDVSFLQFCPAIEHLELTQTDILDFDPVASLTSLKKLNISGTEASDFTFLGRIGTLESLNLMLFHPWPDFAGLERLDRLRSFTLAGNTLALSIVPRLQGLRKARFDSHRCNVPVKTLNELPDMPEVIDLDFKSTVSLKGLERYPKLINLRLAGRYDDLFPMRDLVNLTHVHLATTACPDISPLSELPSLCSVTFEMELPPDLTPLASAPRLHEILLEGTPIVPPELASLNALCESWDNEFAAAEPRKLRKLALRLQQDREIRWNESPAETRDWSDNTKMACSEYLWFTRRFNKAMKRLLGKDWEQLDERFSYPSSGSLLVHITRLEDISRLPEISRVSRKLIASARYPWKCTFRIDSLARFNKQFTNTPEDDGEDDWLIREQKEENEKERKRQEYLKRTYLHRLSLETGVPLPPLPPIETSNANEDADDDDGQLEGIFMEQPEYDLGTTLQLYATLNETHVYVWRRERENGEELFGVKSEDDPTD